MTNDDMFAAAAPSPLVFEQRAWARGYSTVAGIDEAGRGPLAGPVVAAAAVLPHDFSLEGLDDSKKLSRAKREQLYPLIRQQALTAVGVASVAEIDRLNILQATLLAMQRALRRLPREPDHLLIDGTIPLPLALSQQTLKKGDSRSLSIAAASVVAKVVRDRIMHSFDRHYPGYGFAQHKGYGTRQHRRSIQVLGPSPQHRRTFAGVSEWLGDQGD